MGFSTTASGDYGATALGYYTTASGNASLATGSNTTAIGSGSTAMGENTTAATPGSITFGTYNNANISSDNSLMVAGNGTSSNPSDALVLDKDGGLAVFGEIGTGVIPVESAGDRMMWYPAKAAFRAGRVDNTEWDDNNIGNFSLAMGYNTTASGTASIAMGQSTTASGAYSGTIGLSTTASGDYSIAMGDRTTASGEYSVAMGFITNASGFNSTAMGRRTTAASYNSLSIGEWNSANTTLDGTLFVVGNGSGGSARSDALVLDNAGNMTISGTLTESSDLRLKKNISSIQNNTLQKLGNITPSTFEFKNQQTHPDGPQIGLIAQEVQKQFPELVSEASNGYLSVSYSKFTAVLLKGMQEQQRKIKELEEKVNRIEQLRAKVANLESKSRQKAGLPWSATTIAIAVIISGGLVWKRKNTNNG